jgi:hypothetical protein
MRIAALLVVGRERQRLSERLHTVGNEAVEHPRATPLALQQAGIGEHLQMMAHRRLRQAKRLDEIAPHRPRHPVAAR